MAMLAAALTAAATAALNLVPASLPTTPTPQQPGPWKQPVVAVAVYLPASYAKDNNITGTTVEAIMADHGYTFTFGGNESECTKHGLGGLHLTSRIPASASAAQAPPSIWGYNVADEPGTAQFPALAKLFQAIRKNAPGKIGFANLLETYCPPLSLSANPPGAPGSPVNWTLAYEDYVEQYVAIVQPSFLCMDYYPYFEPQQQYAHYNRMPGTTRGRGLQSMEHYVGNVAILRKAGLRHGLRWWNYFGAANFQVRHAHCLPTQPCHSIAPRSFSRCLSAASPVQQLTSSRLFSSVRRSFASTGQGHTAVTEKQMELQMFASLTAGSVGLLAWMLGDGDYHAGWKYPGGRHWEQSRRLNRKVGHTHSLN